MYARISLTLQNRFEGKYGQVLWELCVDYLGYEREAGETAYIPLDKIHKLLAVENSQHANQYKIFNRDVLKPALAEINRVSDLRVMVDCQRKGRKIAALKFKIRRIVLLPEAISQQPDLFPDIKDAPAIHLLKEAGLASGDAWEVWQKGFSYVTEDKRPTISGDVEVAFVAYVREKIDLLQQRKKSGKLQNPSGFLLSALRENYANGEYEKREIARIKGEKIQELRQLVKNRERLQKSLDDAIETLCNEVIALPGQAEKAVAVLEGTANFARW
jgi:Initiator Replication protein